MRELRALAIQGLMALPRRGIEIGGILFGKISARGIRIEGFEEGPCEHRYGPSYALSTSDREKLTELLDARLDNKWSVVGFYRSFTSRDPLIEQADESYIREHFPHGSFLFLMLQPVSLQNCLAYARYFCDGNLSPEGENPPVQFDPAALGTVDSVEEVPANIDSAGSMPAPDPPRAAPRHVTETDFPAERPRHRRRPIWQSGPPYPPLLEETASRATGGERGQVQAGVETLPPPQEEIADSEPLPLACPGSTEGLPVEEEGGELTRATVSSEREPELVSARPPLRSRSELSMLRAAPEPPPRKASLHSPWWAAIAAVLVLLMAGVTYYLWSLARLPHWTDLHIDAHPANGRLEITWDAAGLRGLGATGGLLAVTSPSASRNVELDRWQLQAGKYTYSPFGAEASVRLTVYSRGIGVAGDSVRVESTRQPITAALPADSLPAQTNSPSPAPRLRAVSEPAPVREVHPTIPAGIRSRIASEVVIPVEVEVGKQGQVLRATAEHQSTDGLHRYLAEQAQKAAWKWRFKPARSSTGETLAARRTIRFVFTP